MISKLLIALAAVLAVLALYVLVVGAAPLPAAAFALAGAATAVGARRHGRAPARTA
jgi:hypothetical protein